MRLTECELLKRDVLVTPVLLDWNIRTANKPTTITSNNQIRRRPAEVFFLAGAAAVAVVIGADDTAAFPHLEQKPCPSGIALAQLGQYIVGAPRLEFQGMKNLNFGSTELQAK